MALLELENLGKRFDRPAVEGIHLRLNRGDILGLLGPSGCGKTTLLRLVAGLERPDTGRVLLDGRPVTDMAPHRRNFGLMFQEFALFPHKSVFENVAFGPRMQNRRSDDIRRGTAEMLALVGLTDLADRNVADLSGGERQRVALARSLAPRPRLLMLDEPLGALDRTLRERLMHEIRNILKSLAMTAIFVTHDQAEALAVADRIAVMDRGRIEQTGTPEAVYLGPKSLFVARFFGFQNLLTGRVTASGAVRTVLGDLTPPLGGAEPDEPVTLVLRPESARLAGIDDPDAGPGRVVGRVTGRTFSGQTYRVTVAAAQGPSLVFDLPNDHPPPKEGEAIRLGLRPANMVVIRSRPQPEDEEPCAQSSLPTAP